MFSTKSTNILFEDIVDTFEPVEDEESTSTVLSKRSGESNDYDFFFKMSFKSLPKKIREKHVLFLNLRKFDETVVSMFNSSSFIEDVEERGEFELMP